MPLPMTIGTIAGWTLTVRERVPFANSGIPNEQLNTAAAVLTKGGSTAEIVNGPPIEVIKTCNAVLAAFGAIGAQVTLGDPSTPVASLAAGGAAPYARSVPLTPGTPVPPGRGALVKGGGIVRLKLAGGGFVEAADQSGGGMGSIIRDVAVVDADIPAGSAATVFVLY